MRFQTKQLPSKVAFIEDDLSLKVEKFEFTDDYLDLTELKNFISLSKPVLAVSSSTQSSSSTRIFDTTTVSNISGPLDSFDPSRNSSMSSYSNRSLLFRQEKSGMNVYTS